MEALLAAPLLAEGSPLNLRVCFWREISFRTENSVPWCIVGLAFLQAYGNGEGRVPNRTRPFFDFESIPLEL